MRACAVFAAMALMAGCSSLNPVDWYRDVAGVSKNDAPPEARNTKNLEAGSERPYPNLASVPPPPSTAMSTTEREALARGLVADRQNAKYIDQELRAAPSPPGPRPTPRAAARPSDNSQEAAPPATAEAPPLAAGLPSADNGHEAPPQESPLVSPRVRSVPEPEKVMPPPPRPPVTGHPIGPPAQAAALPDAPVPEPAEAKASLPSPAAVEETSRPPQQQAERAPGTPIEIEFPPNSAVLPGDERAKIAEIVELHRRTGGEVRIVGYAGQPKSEDAAARLASFNMAVDRANAVAAALKDAGVPQTRILIDAAPPVEGSGATARRAAVFVGS